MSRQASVVDKEIECVHDFVGCAIVDGHLLVTLD